ncbi:MAG: efflux RND transporter periplasmic adaptor subunit [Acidobacteria bacterium]|nr:efflux RND transporter periplasmic adaptor subunit [Acidobacteriota bacterium]MCI0620759.1 efflux RND transporter periplasmic adaptor subunit [Acidobacteriota bacterium]MCI0718944.1 efflux RND transporter periplasmic adaptor subunit [Acidobacteriota bacterium]
MHKPDKRFIAAAVLVLLLVAFAVVRWVDWGRGEPSVLTVSGNIELTEADIAFKSAGRLIELAVDEGDTVKKGALIARLDQDELLQRRDSAAASFDSAKSRLAQLGTAIEYQREQAEGQVARGRAELQQAEAVLKELLAGSRRQEVEAARAGLARAETEHQRAERDWERAQTLYKDEDISTAQYDDFKARFESTKAQLKQAREQFDMVQEGPRKEDIEAARAQVERARANVRLAEAARLEVKRMQEERFARRADIQQASAQLGIQQTLLKNAEVVAPMDGVVLVKAAEPGEVLAAGTTVVTLGNLAKPWLRAYINEKDLGRVKLGTEVRVTTDSFPGRVYKGKVSFIASDAEFTPKQIQTQEERVKLVYRIKIDVDNPAGELKSNMPADAEIPLSQQ